MIGTSEGLQKETDCATNVARRGVRGVLDYLTTLAVPPPMRPLPCRRMTFPTRAFALFAALGVLAPPADAQGPTPQRPLYSGALDSATVAHLVDGNLALARKSFDAMLTAPGSRTADNTLRLWDDALNHTTDAAGLADIALQVYPDSAVRQEGIRAKERVSRLRSEITTDPRAARAFHGLDTSRLAAVERLLVSRTLRDFRRAGVLLPDSQRAEARTHLETLDRLSTAFARNIAEDTTSFAVPESDLGGMPPDWIARHRRDASGRVILTMQYPDFFPILTYATNRSLRLGMGTRFENRGRAGNVVVLDSLLRVREAAARLLGYPTWAAYQAEPYMSGSADTIRAFIRRVREVAAPVNARLSTRLLAKIRQEDSSITRLAAWDVWHASELLRRSDYALDSRQIRAYFPFETVRNGVLAVTAELFGVEIRRAKIPVWHPSVEAYEMRENGRLLGRFYLDLHPRPAKYQHAAVFPLRWGIAGRQLPEAMLVTNFPGGQKGEPGLMELNEVVTFFHEFGHLVHDMFARQPYGSLQWPDERDFIEAPSQMLEEFVQLPQVLRRLSKHVEAGRPIPDTLVARLRSADEINRPRQAVFGAALSALSLEIHSLPADRVNVDSVAYRALSDYTGWVIPDTTHFATSFDHIGSNGYAAAYYTYQWSQVISKDLWSGFEPSHPFDPRPARRYRDLVLRPGGGRPAAELVREFLGRPFGFESWRRWLEGREAAPTP
jgi:thimet oligopeptidase